MGCGGAGIHADGDAAVLETAHVKALLAYLPAMRIPDREAIMAALREELNIVLVFFPLPGGGFHIAGKDYRGRLPKGLGLAYRAIKAAQADQHPPVVDNAHTARKSIRSDAARWCAKHAPRLVPVLAAISVERGEVLYDTRPGLPKIVCDAYGGNRKPVCEPRQC